MNMNIKKKGFTLIELLVVISIIGVLSTMVLGALSEARGKARDAKRRSDIKSLQTALEIHYLDKGSYTQPESICTDCSTGLGCGACGTGDGWAPTSDLQDLVTGGYISELPIDPINNSTYKYTYEVHNAGQYGWTKAGQTYDLCASLEEGGSFCIAHETKA